MPFELSGVLTHGTCASGLWATILPEEFCSSAETNWYNSNRLDTLTSWITLEECERHEA